jgi:hypothetical protein
VRYVRRTMLGRSTSTMVASLVGPLSFTPTSAPVRRRFTKHGDRFHDIRFDLLSSASSANDSVNRLPTSASSTNCFYKLIS